MSKKMPLSMLLACMALVMSSCGTSKTERALSGGGIGAGVGALGAHVTGGSAWTGAVIGGAAGAITGAVTDPDDVNLSQ